MSNTWIEGRYQDNPPPEDVSLIIADPVYGDFEMIEDILKMSPGVSKCIFVSVEDVFNLSVKPDQTAFWVKPVSTKNTCRKYSVFVEVILFYDVQFHKMLHWSNRTGIFTDSLLENKSHPWKKPESLIEKLLLNHYPGHGVVYDPCAGSGTVDTVCRKLGIPSLSVETGFNA